jgi:hypothetical protein
MLRSPGSKAQAGGSSMAPTSRRTCHVVRHAPCGRGSSTDTLARVRGGSARGGHLGPDTSAEVRSRGWPCRGRQASGAYDGVSMRQTIVVAFSALTLLAPSRSSAQALRSRSTRRRPAATPDRVRSSSTAMATQFRIRPCDTTSCPCAPPSACPAACTTSATHLPSTV